MGNLWIRSQQSHRFADGGRDDEPIKRVLVVVLKVLHGKGMFCGDGQFDESAFQAVLADVIQIDSEFPQADLDRRFPECCSADVDLRCMFNQLPGFAGQPGVIRQGS